MLRYGLSTSDAEQWPFRAPLPLQSRSTLYRQKDTGLTEDTRLTEDTDLIEYHVSRLLLQVGNLSVAAYLSLLRAWKPTCPALTSQSIHNGLRRVETLADNYLPMLYAACHHSTSGQTVGDHHLSNSFEAYG